MITVGVVVVGVGVQEGPGTVNGVAYVRVLVKQGPHGTWVSQMGTAVITAQGGGGA